MMHQRNLKMMVLKITIAPILRAIQGLLTAIRAKPSQPKREHHITSLTCYKSWLFAYKGCYKRML